jgi:hypothetical protein
MAKTRPTLGEYLFRQLLPQRRRDEYEAAAIELLEEANRRKR